MYYNQNVIGLFSDNVEGVLFVITTYIITNYQKVGLSNGLKPANAFGCFAASCGLK